MKLGYTHPMHDIANTPSVARSQPPAGLSSQARRSRFSAYDASTGKVLWTQQTGTGVGAPPMSYMANGRQFIAVATGAARGGGGLRAGGAIRAFALPAR
jgi:glucose dehydrogenase